MGRLGFLEDLKGCFFLLFINIKLTCKTLKKVIYTNFHSCASVLYTMLYVNSAKSTILPRLFGQSLQPCLQVLSFFLRTENMAAGSPCWNHKGNLRGLTDLPQLLTRMVPAWRTGGHVLGWQKNLVTCKQRCSEWPNKRDKIVLLAKFTWSTVYYTDAQDWKLV